MRSTHNKKGVSLIELMVVVAIIIIAVSAGAALYGPVLRRNELINQLKYTKAAFLKAKSNAIEFTAPVRLTVDPTNGSMLILRDHDRDGSFADTPALVMGLSTTEGINSPYSRKVLPDATNGGIELPVWFQEGVFAGKTADPFPNNGFIILPTGRVTDLSLNPTGGTFFFSTIDGMYYGAVHITSMGEVKMAFLRDEQRGVGDSNGWKWMD